MQLIPLLSVGFCVSNVVIFDLPPINNGGAGAGGVGCYLGATLAYSGLFKSYFVSYASGSASPPAQEGGGGIGPAERGPKEWSNFSSLLPVTHPNGPVRSAERGRESEPAAQRESECPSSGVLSKVPIFLAETKQFTSVHQGRQG